MFPDFDPKITVFDIGGAHGVVDPLETLFIHTELGAERPLVQDVFCALIDDGALLPGKWPLFRIRLNEILAYLWPNGFKKVAKMRQNRIVTADRAFVLHQIPGAERSQASKKYWQNVQAIQVKAKGQAKCLLVEWI